MAIQRQQRNCTRRCCGRTSNGVCTDWKVANKEQSSVTIMPRNNFLNDFIKQVDTMNPTVISQWLSNY